MSWEIEYYASSLELNESIEFNNEEYEVGWKEIHFCEIDTKKRKRDFDLVLAELLISPKKEWQKQGYKYALLSYGVGYEAWFKEMVKDKKVDYCPRQIKSMVYFKTLEGLIVFTEKMKEIIESFS